MNEPEPTWRERGVGEYPQNVSVVDTTGSKNFIDIEGWTVRESRSEHLQGGVQNQLCEKYWYEGEIPVWMELMILYALEAHVTENPNRYYHMVRCRKTV